MRQSFEPQKQLGEVDISAIRFNERSRDDIPRLLRGLQYIHITPELQKAVFQILEQAIEENVNRSNGRPGMNLWRVLVLGTLRLCINCDYEHLLELANQRGTLRQMLGHGPLDEHVYRLQTVCDNVSLLTPEILDQVNQVVVNAGHQLVKKKRRFKAVVTPSS